MLRISIALFTLALSFQAFAAEKKVRARDYSCQALNDMLREEESLYIIYAINDWGGSYQYSTVCKPGFESNAAYLRTADKFMCRIGYVCTKRR